MTDDLRESHNTWLRILVVENSQQRVADFESWLPEDSDVLLKPIRIGNVAITMVERDQPRDWLGIMLDHDLDIFNKDIPYKSGFDVTLAMARRTDREIPVLVHSMNPAGAAMMCKLLDDEGFEIVKRIPYSHLTKADFLAWISECRERAADHLDDLLDEPPHSGQ